MSTFRKVEGQRFRLPLCFPSPYKTVSLSVDKAAVPGLTLTSQPNSSVLSMEGKARKAGQISLLVDSNKVLISLKKDAELSAVAEAIAKALPAYTIATSNTAAGMELKISRLLSLP